MLRARFGERPVAGVVLGTGLGEFIRGVDVATRIPFAELPGFPPVTAMGHAGEFVCGSVGRQPIVILRGRTHCYEGASRQQVTNGIRVIHGLGASTLVVSCAAGGLAGTMRAGDLMVMEDYLDRLPLDRSVPVEQETSEQETSPVRFPSRRTAEPFDAQLMEDLKVIARRQNLLLHQGTYVAVTGPNYETRAEMRFYRQLAHAIGMSTVPEVQVARQLGMRVLGLAAITNVCNPDRRHAATGEHVVEMASQVEPQFRSLIQEFVQSIE